MDDDQREYRAALMDALVRYGTQFRIFEKEDQPNVFLEPELDVVLKNRLGNTNPEVFKHWTYLEAVLNLLRTNYDMFPDADLKTRCPRYEPPEESITPKTLRLVIKNGLTQFKCGSALRCARNKCILKSRPSSDLYDMIAFLEDVDIHAAKRIVGEFFKTKIGSFHKKGSPKKAAHASDPMSEKTYPFRYAVPKTELEKLFQVPEDTAKTAWQSEFIKKAVGTIRSARLKPYFGKGHTAEEVFFSKEFAWEEVLETMGAAARLFIWGHWKQAELGKRLSFTEKEVCQALGVTRAALYRYKAKLSEMGYLKLCKITGKMSFEYKLVPMK